VEVLVNDRVAVAVGVIVGVIVDVSVGDNVDV